jgi:AraC-like DNA-binding protein
MVHALINEMDRLDFLMDKNDIWAPKRREKTGMIPNFLAAGGMRRMQRSFPLHSHPFWEIVLYSRGEGTAVVGRHRIPFRPGTIICNPPFAEHREESVNGFQNTWIAIEQLQTDVDVPVIQLSTEHPIYSIVSILHVEWHFKKATTEILLHNLFNTFMVYLNEHLANHPHERLLYLVKRRLIANIQNPHFRVTEALAEVPMSRDHVRRLFREREGMTPVRYLAGMRMERAKELLQIGLGIKEVAEKVGLEDQYYFSRLFKKTQGMSPSEFRRRMPRGTRRVRP